MPQLGEGFLRTNQHFIQIKNPPEDAEELEELKQKLYPCYDTIGPCTFVQHDGSVAYTENHSIPKFVIIPVEYDLEELWRWTVVLNRFAVSSGNTIGITKAEVSLNSHGSAQAIYPLDHLQEVGPGRITEFRETILVLATNGQNVADALPVLLPQLGIPVDAVGVVIQLSSKLQGLGEVQPVNAESTGAGKVSSDAVVSPDGASQSNSEGTGTVEQPTADGKAADDRMVSSVGVSQGASEGIAPSAQFPSDSGIPMSVIAGSAAAALVMLSAAVVLTLRLRRRAV